MRARAPCAIAIRTAPAPSATQNAYAWMTPRSRGRSSSSTIRSSVSRTPGRLPRGAVSETEVLRGDRSRRLFALDRLDRFARVAAVDQHGGEDRAGEREERAHQ